MLNAKFKEVTGWRLKLLYLFGFNGFTFFNGPVWLRPNLEPDVKYRVMVHEARHIYQIKRDGYLKFTVKYLYYLARYGYRNNPYEIDARKAANERID